jgi:hypothetical protein
VTPKSHGIPLSYSSALKNEGEASPHVHVASMRLQVLERPLKNEGEASPHYGKHDYSNFNSSVINPRVEYHAWTDDAGRKGKRKILIDSFDRLAHDQNRKS